MSFDFFLSNINNFSKFILHTLGFYFSFLGFLFLTFLSFFTDFGIFNITIIIFSGLVLNNVILESVGISFALPVVACDLELTYQQQGVLGAICFVGIIMSSHCWGLLADTRGRKRIIMPTLLLGFVVTFISSFSVNFHMMVVLRFLNGIL